MFKRFKGKSFVLIAAVVLTSCANNGDQTAATVITKAEVKLNPTEGNNVSGTVTFEKVDGGVRVHAELTGLTPGKHGFHIHEYGDCSAKNASSAGGHFNPSRARHGAPSVLDRHAGDFGNIIADKQGNATYDRVDAVIKLNGKNSIIGKSVIVHSDPDDLISQPTGNAGKRAACGVIQASLQMD